MLRSLDIPPQIASALKSAPIPPLPQVLLRLLGVIEIQSISIEELAELILCDPVMVVRVLTAANSVAFRRGKETKNIKDCVQILGTRIIRTIVTCLAIQQAFDPLAKRMKLDLSGFWLHAMLVAETARGLANEVRGVAAEDAYLAGLLHDMGELTLLVAINEYPEVLAFCANEDILPQFEIQTLGIDHAIAGAWLADQWELDSPIADAILFHHRDKSEIAFADPFSRAVWAAHTAVKSSAQPAIAAAALDIDPARVELIVERATNDVRRIALSLGITVPESDDAWPSAFPQVLSTSTASPSSSGVETAVRELALRQAVLQSVDDAGSHADLVRSLRETANILFGLSRLAFFVLDRPSASLRLANDDDQSSPLQQLEISIDPATSAVARAFVDSQALSTFNGDAPGTQSLTDIQITRALNSEGLLHIPMRSPAGLPGVLVIGLSEDQFDQLGDRMAWLTEFVQLASKALYSWQQRAAQRAELEATVSERFVRQARRVAHEAGNPLGIIQNYLTLLSRKLPDDSAARSDLAVLEEEIDRVSRILEDMGELPDDSEDGNLNQLVTELLPICDNGLCSPRGISIETSLAKDVPYFLGNRDSVKQILLNLCKNAATAMNKGGSMRLATHADVLEGGKRYVELLVADNGPGLPPAVKEQLAGNRSSEQAARDRHGLGLDIVNALVAAQNGRLTCRSSPDSGTAFSILLPAKES
jgi:HD-like signal output (HDOD) protein/signal transduction histidine kinase